jgi:leucine-rich repeat protein SHOC2
MPSHKPPNKKTEALRLSLSDSDKPVTSRQEDPTINEKIRAKMDEVYSHPSRLHLNNCGMNIVPQLIMSQSWTVTLQLVDLSGNQLTTIPDLSKLTSLAYLNLSDNKIAEIPEDLSYLSSLRELQLNKNGVSKLTPEFRKLSALERLEIRHNQLKDISELSNLGKLTELHVSGNPIVRLPAGLAACNRLEVLDASSCNIMLFPDALTGLVSLVLCHILKC